MLALSFVCLFVNNIFAQDMKTMNAIIFLNDSKKEQVLVLVPNDRLEYSYRISVLKKNKLQNNRLEIDTIFFPKDIKGFFLEDRSVFISENVSIDNTKKQCFLEELVNNDEITVYAFSRVNGKELYFMKDKRLGEDIFSLNSDPKPYRTYLQQTVLSQCNKFDNNHFGKVKLNRDDIVNAYKAYIKCNPRYLDRGFKMGLMIGYNKGFVPGDNSAFEETKRRRLNNENIIVGLFTDFPLSYKNVSIHPELFYKKESLKKGNIGFSFRRQSLSFPVLVRYSFIDIKSDIIPYLDLGPVFNYGFRNYYYNIKQYMLAEKDSDVAWIKEDVNKFYFGIKVGAGIEYPLFKKYTLYTGIHYSYSKTNDLYMHDILFSVSLSIL